MSHNGSDQESEAVGEDVDAKEASIAELLEVANDHHEREKEVAQEVLEPISEIVQENLEVQMCVNHTEEGVEIVAKVDTEAAAHEVGEEVGDYFTQYKNGEIEISQPTPLFQGSEKASWDRGKKVKQIIRILQEEYDSEPGAPKEEVLLHAQNEGIAKSRAEHEIQKLRDKGEIYTPTDDHLRLV